MIRLLCALLLMLSFQVTADDKSDFEETLQKANAGDVEAQYMLGYMYDSGAGIPENDSEAVVWYLKSAEQGSSDAQIRLAVMYWRGEGVLRNNYEATAWYRRAAEQGRATAQYWLGFRYLSGEGVPQDIVKAYVWGSIAKAVGYSSPLLLDILKGKMTREQIAEAQAIASKCFESGYKDCD